MSLDFAYPNAPANERGWGPGWPACSDDRMVLIDYPSFMPTARIRAEVRPLLVALLTETERRGYELDRAVTDDWAYVCRPTKRADGSLTTTPSNHSWGLAVDLNATRNVYGAAGHEIPEWMPPLWRRYGWRWLGPPIRDWAHFDFCGTPADAKALTAKALTELGEDDEMTEEERDKLQACYRMLTAITAELGMTEVRGTLAGTRVGRAVKKVETSTVGTEGLKRGDSVKLV